MPQYLYRPMAQGASTLIHNESKLKSGNAQIVPGSGFSVSERVAEKVGDRLGLSGRLQDKIGKLKTDDKAAKKKKQKENKPIVFSI